MAWPGLAYPRSRGGTVVSGQRGGLFQGLSPLARGNPPAFDLRHRAVRPIPARAGEPRSTRPTATNSRAYPRSRGGTKGALTERWAIQGLSPLARGNLALQSVCSSHKGPIPARAGEPPCTERGCRPTRAYPRSRGGTFALKRRLSGSGGLSPLARGNPRQSAQDKTIHGPIPARAGEPGLNAPTVVLSRAYPRSRGGTVDVAPVWASIRGLSPLARGNHTRKLQAIQCEGPIPARAGEPKHLKAGFPETGAYPRSRGGTRVCRWWLTLLRGLSPLARGNQTDIPNPHNRGRPIPARAGEPAHRNYLLSRYWAYPRSRGGTVTESFDIDADEGLSPLARGNLSSSSPSSASAGPIPARAGEPFRPQQRVTRQWAYLRSRGGTRSAK